MSSLNLQDIIDSAEAVDLTTEMVVDICNGQVNIFIYHELADISNIAELFKDDYPCILLYELQAKNVGHWVCLTKKDNEISYFDSYGYPVDWALRLSKLNQMPYLTKLLQKAIQEGVHLEQNTSRLQILDGAVNTCGRWSAIRAVFHQLSNQKFARLFQTRLTLTTPDQIVTLMTLPSW
jgi:hypothetical protein